MLLWVAAGISWLLGVFQLAYAIVIVILVNGLFSYWQEYQVERAVEALQALLPRQVMVRRAGAAEAKCSTLREYPLQISRERDHAEALSSALASVGKSPRHAIDESDGLGDEDIADIFTEISRAPDKYLWFLEAYPG